MEVSNNFNTALMHLDNHIKTIKESADAITKDTEIDTQEDKLQAAALNANTGSKVDVKA